MTNRDVNVEKGKQGFQPRAPKPESSLTLDRHSTTDFGIHNDTIRDARKEHLAGELTVAKVEDYFRDISKENARRTKGDGSDPMDRFVAEGELRNLLSDHLADLYFKTDASRHQRKILFDMAWDRGHDSGLRSVEQEYIDLTVFLDRMNKD